jgi:hypothetical protein
MRQNNAVHTETRSSLWQFATCAIVVFGAAILLYIRTVSITDEIILYDAGIATDTGTVQLILPLSRLTSQDGQPKSHWRVGIRGNTHWLDYRTREEFKVPLKAWIAKPFRSTGCRSRHMLGFGYWTGPEWSFARKGPFIVIFVPIYATAILGFAVALVTLRVARQFSLYSLLLTPLILGLSFTVYSWLLHLRIPV